MKVFGREKKVKEEHNMFWFFFFHFNINSKHLTTKIHSFRRQISNKNNFRFILMAAYVNDVTCYHNNKPYFLNKL